jgi:LDH2 family malate/lactate/ureidoglycolate dehydrogenase
MGASQNMIGIAMCNADPQMTIPGASGKVLGTNPIAYAVPASENKSIFLDIATSAAAANKIIRARALGQSIPEGWLVDKDGVPTTDPNNFPAEGALMPMAAHKGYGLALLVEVLCGALTGAAMAKDQPGWTVGGGNEDRGYANQGQTFMAINIGAMMPFETFEQRMGTLITYIHDAPKAQNTDRIFLPGEMEWDKRDSALKDGLTLPPDVVESLMGLAQDTGMSFPGA